MKISIPEACLVVLLLVICYYIVIFYDNMILVQCFFITWNPNNSLHWLYQIGLAFSWIKINEAFTVNTLDVLGHIKHKNRDRNVYLVVVPLPSIHEILGPSPAPHNKPTKKRLTKVCIWSALKMIQL